MRIRRPLFCLLVRPAPPPGSDHHPEAIGSSRIAQADLQGRKFDPETAHLLVVAFETAPPAN
ncbi:MAG: hypothetical protein WA309_03975 [Pseudolabrys sp.]